MAVAERIWQAHVSGRPRWCPLADRFSCSELSPSGRPSTHHHIWNQWRRVKVSTSILVVPQALSNQGQHLASGAHRSQEQRSRETVTPPVLAPDPGLHRTPVPRGVYIIRPRCRPSFVPYECRLCADSVSPDPIHDQWVQTTRFPYWSHMMQRRTPEWTRAGGYLADGHPSQSPNLAGRQPGWPFVCSPVDDRHRRPIRRFLRFNTLVQFAVEPADAYQQSDV